VPTYEYRCTECDHAFEARQAFTDDAIEVCPSCGGKVRKLFGNVGIVFKGSGFYKTDSRDKKSAVSPAESNGSSSDSGSSSGSEGDKKSSGDKTPSDSKGSEGSSAPKSESAKKPADKPAAAASASKSSDK
jgi:putative FmdB family regulatory protein